MDYSAIQPYVQDGLIGVFIILAGMIKIPKIELNLWSLLARKIGKALNGELSEKVDRLARDFEFHLKAEEEDKVRATRRRILRCEGDLRRGIVYTKEAFDELLRDVDSYNKYCNDHPEYENSKTVLAIDYILDTYAVYMKDNKFLK